MYLAVHIDKYRKMEYLLYKKFAQTGVHLHMHAKMETVRGEKRVCLLLVEGGKSMPDFTSGSLFV